MKTENEVRKRSEIKRIIVILNIFYNLKYAHYIVKCVLYFSVNVICIGTLDVYTCYFTTQKTEVKLVIMTPAVLV